MQFYLKYRSCDTSEDLEIYENEIEQSNIVWAYNHADPISVKSIRKHDMSGVFYINLFERKPILKETDIEIIDYQMKVSRI